MAGIIDPFAAKPSNEGQDPSEAEHSVFPTPPTHFEPTTVTQDPLELQDYDLSADPLEDDPSVIAGFADMTSMTSASSSVFVKGEDGHTYRRYPEGKYMMPNDNVEKDRLNLQHQLWLMTLSGHLSLAPLKHEPENVLDLGTGTGAWVIDYALEHPTAQVIGIDLSATKPNFVPPNCTFSVSDFEDEWPYKQNFDLIHGRLLVSCLSPTTCTTLFTRAFASLSPGGYLELQDTDFPAFSSDSSLHNTALSSWYTLVNSCYEKLLGRDLRVVKGYKRTMEEVGFVEVEEKCFVWPINTWPRDGHLKRLGKWYGKDLGELVKGLKAPLIKELGWSLEEVEKFHVDVLKDVDDRNIHAYHIIRVVYGRKPEATESTEA